jgi:toxin-antitoxin system PIN domain toxin
MRLVDANLLVYAFSDTFEQHERSLQWLDLRLNDPVPLGLPWPSLLAFVRLVTNPRVFERPCSMRDAWRQVEEWVACPPVWIPHPTDRHAAILGRLLAGSGSRSALVQDAHLAALALEHGLAVASADADFSRFQGLRWENPLA